MISQAVITLFCLPLTLLLHSLFLKNRFSFGFRSDSTLLVRSDNNSDLSTTFHPLTPSRVGRGLSLFSSAGDDIWELVTPLRNLKAMCENWGKQSKSEAFMISCCRNKCCWNIRRHKKPGKDKFSAWWKLKTWRKCLKRWKRKSRNWNAWWRKLKSLLKQDYFNKKGPKQLCSR